MQRMFILGFVLLAFSLTQAAAQGRGTQTSCTSLPFFAAECHAEAAKSKHRAKVPKAKQQVRSVVSTALKSSVVAGLPLLSSAPFVGPKPFSNTPNGNSGTNARLSDSEFLDAVEQLRKCNEAQQGDELKCNLFGDAQPLMEIDVNCLEVGSCVKQKIIEAWCDVRRKTWNGQFDYRTCS